MPWTPSHTHTRMYKGAVYVFPFSRERGYFLPFVSREDFPRKTWKGGRFYSHFLIGKGGILGRLSREDFPEKNLKRFFFLNQYPEIEIDIFFRKLPEKLRKRWYDLFIGTCFPSFQYAVKVRRHTPWSRGPLSWIPGMLVHALSISLSISFQTAQSSHNSEIYNIGAHAQ